MSKVTYITYNHFQLIAPFLGIWDYEIRSPSSSIPDRFPLSSDAGRAFLIYVQAHDAHHRWATAIVIRDRGPSHRADFYGIPENARAKVDQATRAS